MTTTIPVQVRDSDTGQLMTGEIHAQLSWAEYHERDGFVPAVPDTLEVMIEDAGTPIADAMSFERRGTGHDPWPAMAQWRTNQRTAWVEQWAPLHSMVAEFGAWVDSLPSGPSRGLQPSSKPLPVAGQVYDQQRGWIQPEWNRDEGLDGLTRKVNSGLKRIWENAEAEERRQWHSNQDRQLAPSGANGGDSTNRTNTVAPDGATVRSTWLTRLLARLGGARPEVDM